MEARSWAQQLVCWLSTSVAGGSRRGQVCMGPGAGFIHALGLQKDGEQGSSQGNPKKIRLGSPEE